MGRTQIASGSIVGKGLLKGAKSVPGPFAGYFSGAGALRWLKIEVLVGFGGYPCVRLWWRPGLLGIPSLLHEQNATMGLANRQVSRFAQKIALSFQGYQAPKPP